MRCQDIERGAIVGGREPGARDIVAVGLVDRDHVGQFDDAFLQALQFVAGAGQHQHQEKIGHVGDRGLRLADADRFHQHHVVAGRLAEQHGLARLGGDAAERAGGGRGAHEGVGVDWQAAPCASCRRGSSRRCGVEDGSTASTATLWPLPVSNVPSASMVVDLPAPGAPVMPSRTALPVSGSSSCTSKCAGFAVIGALALDQRDGARQRGAVAGADAGGEVGRLHRCARPVV